MGWVGLRLTQELRALGFHILASDPMLSDERARGLGVEEFVAWDAGKPLRDQVTRQVLQSMG